MDESPPIAAAYHERSKHHLQRYAAGPETLDWEAQPDPFRRYHGTTCTPLPLRGQGPQEPCWEHLFEPGRVAAAPLSLDTLGLLFELSLALAAWKTLGPDRWALRIHPSSGNLHPIEGWLIAQAVPGLPDGLHHYRPEDHRLERRAAAAPSGAEPRAWLALSSLAWREAWKYGERAFRYVQLDTGHALGALRFAAALLGWRLDRVGLPAAELAGLLGLDRDDYQGVERDEPELLLSLRPATAVAAPVAPPPWPTTTAWFGQPNRLDARPMYRWPVIDEVSAATRQGPPLAVPLLPVEPAQRSAPPCEASAAALIRRRRSAQRFDARARSDLATLWPLLQATLPAQLPFEGHEARVHLLLFVHRIDGLAPGAYLLARSVDGEARLRQQLSPELAWQRVAETPPVLRLWRLAENPSLAGTLRTLNCHQALGSDAVLGLALLAEFQPLGDDSAYRERLREAGLVGQALYLAAEAAGLSGTGIGCFFDDELHRLVGLQWLDAQVAALQSVYHFTIGRALPDTRVSTEPPYAHLAHPGPTDD